MRPDILGRSVSASLLALQVLATTGCHSWSTQSGSAESILAARPRDRVRIATVSTPSMTEVAAPRVAGDTLFGVVAGNSGTTAFPLDQITRLQVQKVSAVKTVGLVLGTATGGLIVAGAIVVANCEPSGIGSIC